MMWFAIGIIIGFTFAVVFEIKIMDVSGSLVIEETEDGPYIFLELEKPVDEITEQRAVTLRIKRNKYSTRR